MIEINKTVSVVGAGLAGCEAAWYLANHGVNVDLYEMKPDKYTAAHKYHGFAELVCSNSLKANRLESAAGLLKEEMRILGSLVMEAAEKTSVAAGGALAVDREKFSDYITEKICSHDRIRVIHKEVKQIPVGYVIIASGPLTSEDLAAQILKRLKNRYLHFVDAVAPIVLAQTINLRKVFMAARYNRGGDDYINCPMDENEYRNFYYELINAKTVQLKDFEYKKVYEACMPIEIMAKRGYDTLRFGPLKPIGLINPLTGKRPYAVVQLRCENVGQVLYNMVGFQTNLKFDEQKRVFSMIPGLENADFIRYGVMHLNTFIDSPRSLDHYLRLKVDNKIFFAGQITGVEGYVESAACGLYTGFNLFRILVDLDPVCLPKETMMGALFNYVCNPDVKDFQPMGANMGVLPEMKLNKDEMKNKQVKYGRYAQRAIDSMKSFINLIN